jgi:hypothetical protein
MRCAVCGLFDCDVEDVPGFYVCEECFELASEDVTENSEIRE